MYSNITPFIATLLCTQYLPSVFAIPSTTITTRSSDSSTPSLSAPVHQLFNLSDSGFENLAIRSNGEILATTAFPSALLWYIDPLSIRPPVLLRNFTDLVSATGITELCEDIFYMAGVTANGTNNMYSVDMRGFSALPNGTIVEQAAIKKLGSVPGAGFLNGMTRIQRNGNFVLISDSLVGGVWKFDVTTAQSRLVIQDPSMKGPANQTSFYAFGINGLRVLGSVLYYVRSGEQEMWKMPIHADGTSAGNATLITSNLSGDDFAIDEAGFAYVASPSNALIQVDTRTGRQTVIAGKLNDKNSAIVGGSSAQFGRGPSDWASVYVTTNGASETNATLGTQGITRVDVWAVADDVLMGKLMN